MEKTAKFEKVSLQRFQQDLEKVCPWFDEAQSLRMYESIRLPVRATKDRQDMIFFSRSIWNWRLRRRSASPAGSAVG